MGSSLETKLFAVVLVKTDDKKDTVYFFYGFRKI